MKATLCLLLGLLTVSYGEEHSGEQFSWDSDDAETQEHGLTYSGIIVQVYKADLEEPTITLGTDANHDVIYCFKFLRLFEALNYDISSSKDTSFEEVPLSSIDLSQVNCTANELSTSTFTITCNDVNDGQVTLHFKFTHDTDGDYGLEYTIDVSDYSFVSNDNDAQLVMVQSLLECTSEYPYSADSSSEESASNNDFGSDETDIFDVDGDDDDTETTEEPDTDNTETTDDGTRRRLDEDGENPIDSHSKDSANGISSDDSNEFDAGFTKYVVDGQAYDICGDADDDKTKIDSGLVWQSNDDELHIVFNHFDCELYLDPFIGVDEDKIQDAANKYHVMITIIMGFVVMALF